MSVMVDKMSAQRGGPLAVIGQVLLVSLVAIIGWNIALPGLDPSFMAARTADGIPSQLSLLALGVGPILTALALGQIIRLLVPSIENSLVLVIGEGVVALVLAASQAYGISEAMSAMGILADDGHFAWLAFVASLLGGTAVLLFFSRRVVLPSLVAGFWILWLLPALMGLPAQFSLSFDLLRTGAVTGSQLLVTLAVIAIGAALSIFATRAVMTSYDKSAPSETVKRHVPLLNIVVWPPLLAASAGGFLLTPLAFLAPDSLPDANWLKVYVLATTAILIPIFVFGYRRSFLRDGVILLTPTLLMLAAVQIVLVLGGAFILEKLAMPVPLNGTTLLVLVAVGYALAEALRRPRSTVEV
ncbi:hypothetical protein JZX86_11660 [Agrobacterium rosae]|uniref:hypothetical protein n=1 Tax=Agrobacterium rosae TaxID=1972867 RepID=UPI0019D39940|nr:hypothetical protein [Agrobacterium rosae]MBN7806021.1 hypothetical protein [Agrobacterium rosae]